MTGVRHTLRASAFHTNFRDCCTFFISPAQDRGNDSTERRCLQVEAIRAIGPVGLAESLFRDRTQRLLQALSVLAGSLRVVAVAEDLCPRCSRASSQIPIGHSATDLARFAPDSGSMYP